MVRERFFGGGALPQAIPAFIFGDSEDKILHSLIDQGGWYSIFRDDKLFFGPRYSPLSANYTIPAMTYRGWNLVGAAARAAFGRSPYTDPEKLLNATGLQEESPIWKIVSPETSVKLPTFESSNPNDLWLSESGRELTNSFLRLNSVFQGLDAISNLSSDLERSSVDKSSDVFGNINLQSLVQALFSDAFARAVSLVDVLGGTSTLDRLEELSREEASRSSAIASVEEFRQSVLQEQGLLPAVVTGALSTVDSALAKVPGKSVWESVPDFLKQNEDIYSVTSAWWQASIDTLASAIKFALSSAVDAVGREEGELESYVQAFKNKSFSDMQESIGRMSGLFVDINAVNSSSFVWARALLERDHNRRVDDFRARIRAALLERLTASFMDGFLNGLSSVLSAVADRVRTAASVFQSIQSEKTRAVLTTLTSYFETALRALASYQNAQSVSLEHQDGLVKTLISGFMEAARAFASLEADGLIRGTLEKYNLISTYARNVHETLVRALLAEYDLKKAQSATMADFQVNRAKMHTARILQDIELEKHEKIWVFEQLASFANVLGTPAGIGYHKSAFERFATAIGEAGPTLGPAAAAAVAALLA